MTSSTRRALERDLGTLVVGALFLTAIVGANVLTSTYGLVPVGLGLYATAGTYLAGLCFVLRDAIHDLAGPVAVAILIGLGAVLSFALSEPFIALASASAFLVSEVADWAVYQPLRRRGYIRAALTSNTVGALVDTVLFLWVAGFPIWSSIPGQLVGKLTITALTVLLVIAYRAGRRALPRQPVRA